MRPVPPQQPNLMDVIKYLNMDANYNRSLQIEELTQTISNPPTQAQIKLIQQKINDVIRLLKQ